MWNHLGNHFSGQTRIQMTKNSVMTVRNARIWRSQEFENLLLICHSINNQCIPHKNLLPISSRNNRFLTVIHISNSITHHRQFLNYRDNLDSLLRWFNYIYILQLTYIFISASRHWLSHAWWKETVTISSSSNSEKIH